MLFLWLCILYTGAFCVYNWMQRLMTSLLANWHMQMYSQPILWYKICEYPLPHPQESPRKESEKKGWSLKFRWGVKRGYTVLPSDFYTLTAWTDGLIWDLAWSRWLCNVIVWYGLWMYRKRILERYTQKEKNRYRGVNPWVSQKLVLIHTSTFQSPISSVHPGITMNHTPSTSNGFKACHYSSI